MAVPQLFLVRNSAIDFVVRNIAELRTKIADAHLCIIHIIFLDYNVFFLISLVEFVKDVESE
jgi:hypothetical protein